KQSENSISVLESENKAISENLQKCLKYKTELELKLKSCESESSLRISQTELALSRLTGLRSQVTQLQSNNEQMEEFLARFKTTESTMATAEQSGELFNRLRKVLNEVNKLKDVENREEKITLIENSTEQEPTVVEPDIAMDGPLNLSEVLSEV
ncbi:unnamed protein product, partial [Hymenolepis diminuta]|uniref:GOLGA2L5 domain-containing protein n=1 Tax=Hymenolepis diminuta TaxID=6216 RepID=A0A0R3SHE9_HYMDI